MIKARGRFNRMADRAARDDAARLTPEELCASLRDNATFAWKPPGGGFVAALSHDVGSGTPLTGPAQDLLLVLCGRHLPAGRLHGEPSPRFTRTRR